jgi:hypothetical protein
MTFTLHQGGCVCGVLSTPPFDKLPTEELHDFYSSPRRMCVWSSKYATI